MGPEEEKNCSREDVLIPEAFVAIVFKY